MQQEKTYKLLYVEDDVVDVMSFERNFAKLNPLFDCDIADTIASAFDLVKSGVSYDVIISDYNLPDGQATDLLDEIKHIPVIIVTGVGDEKLAVSALKNGAYDYITKDSSSGYLTMLPHTIEKAMAHKADRLQLKSSQIRYQNLIESANDVIYECDANGRFLFVNSLASEFTGYSSQELLQMSFYELIVINSKDSVIHFYKKQFLEHQSTSYLEFQILRKDGKKLWVGQNVTALSEGGGDHIGGFLGVVRDISLKKKYELKLESVNLNLEQKVQERTNKLSDIANNLTKEIELRHQVEKELRVSRQSYIDLFNNVSEAILVFDPKDERILEANSRALELYDYSKKELFGISRMTLSTDADGEKEHINKILNLGKSYPYETIHLDKHKREIFIEMNATKAIYEGKEVILCVNRDLTKRKLVEEQLEVERKKRISSLIDGQEIERKRLSRDLHDGLGQLLFAIKLHAKKLSNSSELVEKDNLLVSEIMEILEMTIVETRQIYQNLLPSSLSDFGLEVALKQVVKVTNENSDTEITYAFKGRARRLNTDLEIGIYRIAQEAINNSNRHSKGLNIWVSLEMSPKKIRLEVKDNGTGFKTAVKSDDIGVRLSHGMNNMKQRAEVLGLDLLIDSTGDEGTSIVLKGNTGE